MRACMVYINGREAGTLKETDKHQYIFTYNPIYVDKHKSMPVCLSMPVRKEPYISDNLFPYFFNILSEGANRRMQSMLLHIDEKDDFGILLATAQFDAIGAVTVKPIEDVTE